MPRALISDEKRDITYGPRFMKIGPVELSSPFALAPMAGLTDTAFRRLVKRRGGCGLVITEMVSADGLVRGLERTLAYAEYTEEERPVSIQIFGRDPETMAAAARRVEQMGADVVDVNMGCPVPKVAKRAGCSLMREPAQAAAIVGAMTKAVRIPVTVKMRAGWDDREINAADVARRVEEAGAAAVAVHGRTAAQGYTGLADWALIAAVARHVSIPVFGSGDCADPVQVVERQRAAGVAGVLVGRGALRNPWIFAQAAAVADGRSPRLVTLAERGQFLLDYLDLLLHERVDEREGFRHEAAGASGGEGDAPSTSDGRARWVVNKVRALAAWYTKGLHHGARLRVAINAAGSIQDLRTFIGEYFFAPDETAATGRMSGSCSTR